MSWLLDPSTQIPLRYILAPVFLGVTAGPIYGGVTGAMMNMSGTAAFHQRVLRCTAAFSAMGLAYGMTGLWSMRLRFTPASGEEWEKADDYITRFSSGCAAGVTLGITNKSIPSACGACLSLGMLSVASKYYDEHRNMFTPDARVKEMLKPVLTKDVPLHHIGPRPDTKA